MSENLEKVLLLRSLSGHTLPKALSLWVKTAQAAESSYGQFIGTLKEESEGMLAPVVPASRCSNNFFF